MMGSLTTGRTEKKVPFWSWWRSPGCRHWRLWYIRWMLTGRLFQNSRWRRRPEEEEIQNHSANAISFVEYEKITNKRLSSPYLILSPDDPRRYFSSQGDKGFCVNLEEISEEKHAVFAHMARTEDDSEVDLTSETEPDSNKEDRSNFDDDEIF